MARTLLLLALGVAVAFDVASAQVTVSGATVTINPSSDLASLTGYYVQIDSGAVEDTAGNDFAALTGSKGMGSVVSWQ